MVHGRESKRHGNRGLGGLGQHHHAWSRALQVGQAGVRLGSLYLETSGPSKGQRRKTKALGKKPTPLATWEKLLASGEVLGSLFSLKKI